MPATSDRLLLARGLPLTLACVWLWHVGTARDVDPRPEVWFLAAFSALANLIVLWYHFTVPAHPKFLIRPRRRLALRIHVVSGTVEFAAGLVACFHGSAAAGTVMALTALGLHVPSALLQLPIVFGSRAIMEPAYVLSILAHAFCAGMLLADAGSRVWAVNTFLVFNVYVWCRLYYYVFDLLGLFQPMKYSAAILAAGFTILPAVFGPTGVLACVVFIGLYAAAHRLLVFRRPEEYAEFTREKARDTRLPEVMLERLDEEQESRPGAAEDAAAWFRHLDRSALGRLERDDVLRALAPWGLPPLSTEAFADRLLREGPVTEEQFHGCIWSVGAIRRHARRTLAIERAGTDREKAGLVFQILDIDRDGRIGRDDLDWLLAEWSLPLDEIAHYASGADDGWKGISPADFITRLEPVWRFIFEEILRANFSRRGTEMFQRGGATARGSRHAEILRRTLRAEMLAAVPFLRNADDSLIGNLAASLLIQTFPAGAIIMREGDPGAAFYLIAQGSVRVERSGTFLGALGPGGSIGEGSLLTGLPRAATVVAETDCRLFALARPAFSHLIANYPEVRSHLEELHASRRAANGHPPADTGPAGEIKTPAS